VVKVAQVEDSRVVRQIDGVHIPSHLLAIGNAVEIAHAGVLGTESPTGTHISGIGGSEFLGEYGLPLRWLYINLKERGGAQNTSSLT